jgi:hypothetical protein
VKKAISLLLLFSFSISVWSQQSSRFATLDRYFAGIPLQSSFESWYDYVSSHPYLGIDSSSRRGNFSSFKPGIESYFPFPDSMGVKILFHKVIYMNAATRQFIDSFKQVSIEANFGSDKFARRESVKFYRGLRKELMRNYRYEYRDYYNQASWFYRGKNKNFPYCSINYGYSERFKFYYVALSYNDQKSQPIKSYPPPDNTLRH